MLSRVAENLYWMARYVERAENTARVVSVNANLLLDLPRGLAPGWKPLIDITGLNDVFEDHYQDYGERQVVKFLLADPDNPGSVLSSLNQARETCRTVRDILPRTAWEMLNELHLYSAENLQTGLTKRGRHGYLRRIISGSQMLTGMLGSVMTRDEGYQFLCIGRNLERADMTTRIIDVRSADLLPEDVADLRPFDTIQWVSVLHSLSAYQMYRRTMQVQVKRQDVLRFLFRDPLFPRAVMHCLDAAEESLGTLKNHADALKSVRSAVRKIQRVRVDRLAQSALHDFVDDLQLSFIRIHEAVAGTYFLPAPAEESLA
jgi:uncharacterized alpha-E superfamily protein